MFTPSEMLGFIIGLTGLCYGLELLRRRRSHDALRSLAAEWRMNFGEEDTLRLTPKVARHFQIPGAANLRVVNVIYGLERDRYRYIFTVEYTVGVVRGRHRLQRAAAFSESRHRERGEASVPVMLGAPELPLIEQYRQLSPLNPALQSAG